MLDCEGKAENWENYALDLDGSTENDYENINGLSNSHFTENTAMELAVFRLSKAEQALPNYETVSVKNSDYNSERYAQHTSSQKYGNGAYKI